ncbi:MAG: RagB/SusD family nutrient uptake outer membrane protein [Paludibacteraceae bacterium]|nr:RagB/SusD family nutrient uptake outer membrane protein [Paludibacteraceae bacterium]
MKILHYILLGLSSLCCACSFLNENPVSELKEEQVIEDAASLRNVAVANLYSLIGSDVDGEGLHGTYRGVYDLLTLTSDEAIIPVRGGDWQDGGLWLSLFQHTWSAENEVCENAWNYLFKCVVMCNNSLCLLDKYSYLLSSDELQAYQAEVRGLRAMYYYYLLDLFARVPILTEANQTVTDVASRSEVFDFVRTELTDVLPYLVVQPSNVFGSTYGHFTQPVAAFLLMKLALNAAIYTDDDWTDEVFVDASNVYFSCGGQCKNAWQAVCFYAEVIRQAGHVLDGDYTTCFSVRNEVSRENIFVIPMDPTLYSQRYKYQFRSLHYQHASSIGYGGENGTCATLETLEAFSYGTSRQDNRFSMCFFADTIYVDDEPLTLSNGSILVYMPLEVEQNLTSSRYIATAGARMYKYEIDPNAIVDGTLRHNDIVLYRYADVLLMEAEAMEHLGQDPSEKLHLVRSRAQMPDIEPTLENIYAERQRELVWEGWRRQDMIRQRIFTRQYRLSQRQQVEGEHDSYGFTTVFPIPQSLLDMNKSIKQNAGY